MVSKSVLAVVLTLIAFGDSVPTDWHRRPHYGHPAIPWNISSPCTLEAWEPSAIPLAASAGLSKITYGTIYASHTSLQTPSSRTTSTATVDAAVSSAESSVISHTTLASSVEASSAKITSAKVSSARAVSTSTSTPMSSAAPAASGASDTSSAKLTPHNKKAGMSGEDAYTYWQEHMGWFWNYTPFPNVSSLASTASESTALAPVPIPILWGDGHVDAVDKSRFDYFKSTTSKRTDLPYVMGFYEPDCSSTGSSSIPDVDTAVALWEELIAPMKAHGTKLGSPGMCKQADETWLKEFQSKITTMWDFTTIHVNKVDMDGVNKDLDHYWDTYGLPIWVTEFSCTQDVPWVPSEDQTLINQYLTDIVPLFEKDDRVLAYAYSTGEGLADAWMPVKDGQLTESGQKYLDLISAYSS